MDMAGNDETSGTGRSGGIHLSWRNALPLDHLRLREKASMIVFALAAMLAMLVTLIVVLEHLDRAGLVTAETARATQLSLDRFSLAMNQERSATAAYLLTRDPQALARYHAARDQAGRDERQLVGLA